jgi:hypothetical protein
MGAFESGQTFMAGVLAKLPAEQRAAAEAIFNAAEAKEAVVLIGDGALARSDYSRNMDTLREKEQELTAYYTNLNTWYSDNKAALDAAVAARNGGSTGGTGNGTGTPPAGGTPPADGKPPAGHAYDPDEVRRIADEAINAAGRDYIAVNSFMLTQYGRHVALFGEPLDMTEITSNPKLGRPIAGQPGRIFSLQDAYNERYGERVAAKVKEAEDKRFNDEVEKRLAERIKATSSTHPFPLRQEASPLDVLSTKEGPAAYTVDSAVAEYERLQQARGA